MASKGLNGRLFIDTKDRRMLRWIQIEANDISRFELKVWIVRGPVALQTMRTETGFMPNAMNHRLADV